MIPDTDGILAGERRCKHGHVLVYANNNICGHCNQIAGRKGGKAHGLLMKNKAQRAQKEKGR